MTGARRADAAASTGSYLALAALNRLVAPCSKAGLSDWWKTTAADRFTRIPASALDHRRFWDAMHAVTLEDLEEISRRIAAAGGGVGVRVERGAGHDQLRHVHRHRKRAGSVAQRGKAEQKRTDGRLVGLGLVVTRDGGLPLTWHAYPGDARTSPSSRSWSTS